MFLLIKHMFKFITKLILFFKYSFCNIFQFQDRFNVAQVLAVIFVLENLCFKYSSSIFITLE